MKEAALEYARQGFAVFPVQSPADAQRLRAELAKADLDEDERGKREKKIGEKKPFPGTRGVHEATTDEAKIKKRWTEWPEANIAWCPAMSLGGTVAVDLDVDKGDGEGGYSHEDLDALKLPRTGMAIRTPSGGLHLVYALKEGELLPPSTSKVGQKIDIRCKGSYGLLPPSKGPDGTEYTWKSRGDPAFRSDALVEAAGKARERDPKAEVWLIEQDLPEHDADYSEWLKGKAETGTCGVDGNHTLAKTGAMGHSFGLSEELTVERMLEHWNPRCEPPWSEEELRRHAGSGWRSATSPPGNLTKAYKRAEKAARFSKVEGGREAKSAERPRFRLYTPREGLSFKGPTWKLKEVLPDGAYTLLHAPKNSFKSFVAMNMALVLGNPEAAGGDNPWKPEDVANPGPVLYVLGEGARGMPSRMEAWRLTYLCKQKEEGPDLANVHLTDPMPTVLEGLDRWFEDTVNKMPEPPSLVILDTLSYALAGLNDNEAQAGNAFVALLNRMKSVTEDTSVLVLHHPTKDNKGNPRGSGVIKDAADVVLAIGVEDPNPKRPRVILSATHSRDGPTHTPFGHEFPLGKFSFSETPIPVPYRWEIPQGDRNRIMFEAQGAGSEGTEADTSMNGLLR